jgi:hypothetical protein
MEDHSTSNQVPPTNNNGQDSSSQEQRVVTSVDHSQVCVDNKTALVGVDTCRQIFAATLVWKMTVLRIKFLLPSMWEMVLSIFQMQLRTFAR